MYKKHGKIYEIMKEKSKNGRVYAVGSMEEENME